MNKNIDGSGRIIRLVVAILLLVYAYFESSWFILAVSLFVFFEAFASWCVINALLGKSSCQIDTKKQDPK